MKPVERWMYRTLLQSMFFHSTRPFLPKDDDMLWMLAGCESKDQWMAHKSIVLSMFLPIEDEPDLLQNKRVNEDWKIIQKARKRYSMMGRISAMKRSTLVEHKSNASSRSKVKGSGGEGKESEERRASFQPEEV